MSKKNEVTKREPFIMLEKILIAPLSPSELKVLCAIKKHTTIGGKAAFPSLNGLRTATGLSIATLCKAIKGLKDMQIMSYQKGSSRKKANEYTLLPIENWKLPQTLKVIENEVENVEPTTQENEFATTLKSESEPLQEIETINTHINEININENHQQHTDAIAGFNFSWLAEILNQGNLKQLLIETLFRHWWSNGQHEQEYLEVIKIIEEHFASNQSPKAIKFKSVLISTVHTIRLLFRGLDDLKPETNAMLSFNVLEKAYKEAMSVEGSPLINKLYDNFKCTGFILTADEISIVRMYAHAKHKSNTYQWAFDAERSLHTWLKKQPPLKPWQKNRSH